MPQIREFTNPVTDLRPDVRGEEVAGQAARIEHSYADQAAQMERESGRAIGGAIAQAGGKVAEILDRHETMMEISHGAANLSVLTNGLTAQVNDAVKNSDPNDPSVIPGLNEKVIEPALQKFQEAFKTDGAQRWAIGRTGALRDHFNSMLTADQSTRAGDALVANLGTMKSNFSNAAFNDPSSLDHNLGAVDSSIGDMLNASPSLTPQMAEKAKTDLALSIKKDITKSAFTGLAMQNPDLAEKKLGDGAYAQYMDGSEAKGIITVARAQIRQNQMFTDHENEMKYKAADNALAAQFVQPDGSYALPKDYFLKVVKNGAMPGAPAGATEAGLSYGIRIQKEMKGEVEKGSNDPTVYPDLLRRATAPTADDKPLTSSEVLKERALGKIDENTKNNLMAIVNDDSRDRFLDTPIVKATLNGVKARITYQSPNLPGKDPEGQIKYANFLQDFVPKYIEASKSGQLLPNALDLNDPKSMVSQSMNAPGIIRTSQERMADWNKEQQDQPQLKDQPTKPAAPAADAPPRPKGVPETATFNATNNHWYDPQTSKTWLRDGRED